MRVLFSFIFLAISLTAAFSQDSVKSHKDSLIAIVQQYYSLNLKVFQANSQPSNIDDVFSMFTPDFIYNHPKYGGEYSREKLYNGYIRNQKNGNYNGRIIDIKIVNQIAGLNSLAVEKQFINKTDSGPKEGDLQMTLFEFRKGKIFRITEYW